MVSLLLRFFGFKNLKLWLLRISNTTKCAFFLYCDNMIEEQVVVGKIASKSKDFEVREEEMKRSRSGSDGDQSCDLLCRTTA